MGERITDEDAWPAGGARWLLTLETYPLLRVLTCLPLEIKTSFKCLGEEVLTTSLLFTRVLPVQPLQTLPLIPTHTLYDNKCSATQSLNWMTSPLKEPWP
jgi:hypothetical protein